MGPALLPGTGGKGQGMGHLTATQATSWVMKVKASFFLLMPLGPSHLYSSSTRVRSTPLFRWSVEFTLLSAAAGNGRGQFFQAAQEKGTASSSACHRQQGAGPSLPHPYTQMTSRGQCQLSCLLQKGRGRRSHAAVQLEMSMANSRLLKPSEQSHLQPAPV